MVPETAAHLVDGPGQVFPPYVPAGVFEQGQGHGAFGCHQVDAAHGEAADGPAPIIGLPEQGHGAFQEFVAQVGRAPQPALAGIAEQAVVPDLDLDAGSFQGAVAQAGGDGFTEHGIDEPYVLVRDQIPRRRSPIADAFDGTAFLYPPHGVRVFPVGEEPQDFAPFAQQAVQDRWVGAGQVPDGADA